MHHLTRRCHRSIRRVPRPSKDPNKKKRKVKNLLFTDCPARITLTVRKTDTGEMEFVTSNEVSTVFSFPLSMANKSLDAWLAMCRIHRFTSITTRVQSTR